MISGSDVTNSGGATARLAASSTTSEIWPTAEIGESVTAMVRASFSFAHSTMRCVALA